MTHILNIEVPDEIYIPLQARARAAGQTPEAWASSRLKAEIAASADKTSETTDPLERFIGAFSSSEANRDWADNHDEYLAESLKKEMSGQDSTT